MNVKLYLQIFRRFWFVMLLGFIAAVALATLSFAKVSVNNGSPKLTYRQSEIWGGQVTLMITQTGFPEGRSILPDVGTGATAQPKYADPSRLAALADFYSRIATSDRVLDRIPGYKHAKKKPVVTAGAVVSTIENGGALPLLAISGQGKTPQAALRLTKDAADAFRAYLTQQQTDAGIPDSQRVILSVLDSADKPFVVKPRKKTIPILVFLMVLVASCGFALILEHMRPRVRPVAEPLPAPRDLGGQRTAQPAKVEVGRADAVI